MYQDILYEKGDGVARITINRPKVRNAFRLETVNDLIKAFEDVSDDSDIGVAVLTGAGNNFSSGGDVKMEAEFDASTGRKLYGRCLQLSTVMRNLGKPIVAAVRGYCVGGGNELNMLCDLSITEEGFRLPVGIQNLGVDIGKEEGVRNRLEEVVAFFQDLTHDILLFHDPPARRHR